MTTPYRQPTPRRRGSGYGIVLPVALLLLVIGVGTLENARIKARSAGLEQDWHEAGLLAFSAVEHVSARIHADPAWRYVFADYEAAYRNVAGTRARCLDDRTVKTDTSVAARKPSAKADKKADAIARARDVGDLLTGLAGFLFIACPCGVQLKVPPEFKRPTLPCPRCGRDHDVPKAETSDSTPAPGKPPRDALRFTRKGTGWESFRCTCGHPVQLSPSFSAALIERAKPAYSSTSTSTL